MSRLSTQGHSLNSVCSFMGISRQAYYKRLQKQESKSRLYRSLEDIVIENRRDKSRAGLRTIYHKEGMSSLLGVNQFENQMSARGYALKPYRTYVKTTDSRGDYYKYDNLIAGRQISNENQVLVGDITYYQNQTGRYYIFHFVDYYTLELKGLIGSGTMEGINSEKCLRQIFAYNNRKKYDYKMIIHTDAGSQYRSHNFQKMLRKAQILPSQARNCFENGLSERENGIIKNEYLVDYDIRSVKHLNTILKRIQYKINNVWPSKTLGYKTPREYASWLRKVKVKERPVKTIKIVQ
ncbi:Mobile element protein [hydrothermal vent metagenome]|uniref:Mobile element protein n=1 Tax=hydrothermal vent metagenome TaxID=652676 RepID=A0A3B0UVM6_9ZZZZ